jgi:hypothetical protein
MDALGDAVVRDDQLAQYRDVVEQPTRFGRRRDPAKPFDEVSLSGHCERSEAIEPLLRRLDCRVRPI